MSEQQQSAKMWSGRFREPLNNQFEEWQRSFPFDYRNGIKEWHFDPAKWMIFVLSRSS